MEIKETYQSALTQLRESHGLTRRELSEQSGINFRSLQDYEQGHKDLSSAKADTVYRLSVALGCNMEDLILQSKPEIQKAAQSQRNRLMTYYRMLMQSTLKRIEDVKVFSSEYRTCGRLIMKDFKYFLTFCYKGELVELPFEAVISEKTLPWLEDVALMQMNSYIRNREFESRVMFTGGNMCDES